MSLSLRVFLLLSLLTGVIYPVFITQMAQIIFPFRANGSILEVDGVKRGSELIAQKFTQDKYFWPRPSAVDYQTIPSSGSNLSLTSKELVKQVQQRALFWRRTHSLSPQKGHLSAIPSDLLYASGSGVDPHISIAAAFFQLNRVAAARHWTGEKKEKLKELIHFLGEVNTYPLLGEPRINVLLLNLNVDSL